jgi:hypothetical protein
LLIYVMNSAAVFTQGALSAAHWNTAALVLGAGVALAGDLQLRGRYAPAQGFAIKLPKLGFPKLPGKLPSLPSLPKVSLGSGKAAKSGGSAASAAAKTGSRTPARGAAAPGVRVRPATTQSNLPSGPTFVDPTQARVMDQGKGWKAFPGRRLPGKNMEQFLDMARSLRS